MKKFLLLLITLMMGLVAQATLQDGIALLGQKQTANGKTYYAFVIRSMWGGDQIPRQEGSSHTFSNTTLAGVTLNGTLNFQESSSGATDVIAASSFTVTITKSDLWFYGATVQTKNGTDVTGSSTSVSNNNHTLTVTIPSGKTFGQIIFDYVSNAPFSSSNTVISGLDAEYLYLGSPIEPEPVVTYNGAVLTKDTDYTLSYWGSNRVGEAQLTVTGTGEFAGDISKRYTIRKVALTDFNSLGNNTYEIADTTDLNYLALYISGNDYGSGITFKQTADIAYNYSMAWNAGNNHENNFTAIGRWGHSFRGTYDGQNHTISGIRIYKNDTTNYDTSQGLFGYISSGAIVKNVILADARITGYNNTGGIVGYNSGAIEDCRVESNVMVRTAKKCSAVGGIAGISNGANTTGVAIRRCTFKGTVFHGTSNSTNIGGIVGTLTSSPVSNCLALGAYVRGYDYSGAIAGIKTGTSTLTANYYHDCTVNNNVNSGASVNVGVGIGSGSEDQDGARSVHALTLPDGVTATGETVDIDGVTHYAAGTTVTLACSNVPEGYMVKYSLDGNAITGDTFTMPAADATVTVQIIAIDYSITLPSDLEHATVTSDKATAHIGDTVTLTVTTEDESYIVSSLTVMNGNNEVEVTAGENNTYTFVMPAANVSVNVEIQRLRYIFNSETGVLKLIYGPFNKDNKWGNDVNISEVTSVTATDEVRFTGDCSELFSSFRNCTSMDLSNVNTDSVTIMSHMFYYCPALTSLDLSDWNTANVTDMGNMFILCSSLSTLEGISNWNTAAVTEMNNMFEGCSVLTSLDLSSWNTAAVTDMGYMFYNCSALTSLDLSGWNTAAVTYMKYMFSGCMALTTIEGISSWNTAEVIDMSGMFYYCSSLTSLDLSGWDTGKVAAIHEEGHNGMFKKCTGLTSLNLTGWNMGNITDMSQMFYDCSNLTTIEGISGWDVSNVTDMSRMFAGCQSVGSLDLSGWNTSEVTDMDNMFGGCSNLATIYAGKEWNTENVTISGGMFSNCTSLVGGMSTTFDPDHTNAEYARYDHGYDEPGYLTGVFTLILPEDVTTTTAATLTHNGVNYYKAGSDITLSYNGTPPENMRFYHFTVGGEPIDGDIFAMPFADAEIGVELQARYTFDSTTGVLALNYGEFNNDNKWGSDVNPDNVTSVTATSDVSFTGDCSQLFYNFTNCTSMDLNNVNTSEMTSSYNMFNGCSSLTSLDLSGWNTASVTDMSRMFFDCADLTTLDLSGWNTGNVTDMSQMFSYNSSLDSLDLSGWNTGNVILMNEMFLKCTGLTTLNVSGWNTGNVTNMISMFSYCSKLEMLDLSSWNTANVTDINSMFDSCSSLTSLNLSGWNTGKVTKMNGMFYGCSSLTSLDLSNWNTASVTEISAMFMGCSSLDSLNLSGWNNTNVTYMDKLFSGCSSLTSLDLTNFETTIVNEMSNMFEGCSSLTSLDLSGWNTGNVCRLNAMFSGCSSLTSLNLSGWNVSNVTDMGVMFNGCSSLTALDVSGWNTSNVEYMNNMFSGCTGLTTLDLTGWNTSNVENMKNMFYGCTGLTTIYAGNGWSAEDVYLGTNQMFENCTSLVGGMSTTFDPNHTDGEYARIDHGADEPGYLTGVFALTLPEYVTTTAVATLTHNGVNLYAAGDTITLNYGGEVPEGYAPVYSVNGNAIEGDTFVMPFEDATVTVEVQRLRYIYDSETHELALLFGPFNKNDKWGDDVPAEAVTSVTATDEVRFTGDCSQLFYSFNNCTSMDLSNVNTSEATNMASMFLNCVSLESLDVSNWNTGKVTDMGGMFSLCGNLYSLDISSWNTANVTDLSAMFASCRSLDSLDISSWDVSNVTNMTSMFYSCSSLTTLDLSTWNTGNVTDMGSMFGDCTGLTTLDLKGWDVSNVTSTATMFNGCSSLTALDVSDWTIGSANLTSMFLGCTGLTTLDLSTWDTSNVTDMNGMFINCASLTTIYVGEGWTTENVTSTGVLFLGCTSLVGGMGTTYDADHIGLDYARMDRGGDEPGYLTGVFALTLPEDVTASPAATLVHDNVNLYAAGSEITLSYGGEVPEGYGPVYSVNGNTIGGNTFEMPFGAATVTVEVQRARYIYNSETGELALNWGEFNKNDKWGDDVPIDSVTSVTATSDVSFTGDCSELFYGFRNCTSMDLSKVNTSEATNMASMFLNCVSLESLDVSNWNTGKVTDMSSMFVGCMRLESLDILNWNTASVANMSSMFTACSSLTALDISNWDTGSVTNMSSMFTGCTSLTTLNITGWNTASVNSMSNMFIACPNLESLDLSGWNTASVTNISAMFNGCTNLTTIYVGEGWTTEKVTGSGGMFGGCTSLVGGMGTTYDADHTDAAYAHIDGGPENPGYLTEWRPRYTFNPETGVLALNWGEFNKDDKWGDDVPADSVKSVTATDEVSFTGDCSQLFYNFTNCTSMDLSKVNTDSVTKMSVMFAGCSSLDSLDISSWNTANVTNMGIMFNGCSSLKTLDLSSWDVSNVTNIGNMFQFCQSLESLNLSGWNTSSVTNMSNMFQNCTNLTTLDLSGWDISNIANVGVIFYGCTSLTTLDVSGWTIGNANLTTLFLGCTGITTLDLSTWNTAGVTNMSSMFAGSANLTTIYVGEGWTTEKVTSSGGMFDGCSSLVGGMGTTYDADHTDAEYAHIDGGPENPGYFTEKLPRYTYNPETGELALIWGEFNKDDKWGDDVPIDSVKSVTATDEVSFTGDCSQLFRGFRNCTSMDLSKVNTSEATNMRVMFAGCTSLNSLDISSWNTANVTNMGVMFQVCQSLETLDISSWDVSNVTEMGVMFDGCTSLKTLDLSGWNISNVTNMSNMFFGCTSLETVNLSGWSIGTATLQNMFLSCTNLTTVDLSGWTIENATGLSNMFTNCSSLTTLDVSDWNIVQANMSSIFCACGLTTLDLSTWNTAGVTNMNYMFAGSANLTTIYVGEGWTTENVTSSGGMFSGCTNLVGGMGTTYDANHIDAEYAHIDGGPDNPGYLTEWRPRYTFNPETGELTLNWGEFNKDDKWGDDVPAEAVTSVTATSDVSFTGDCSELFYNFNNCTSMDLNNVNTDSVTSMSGMFSHCNSLTSLDLSGWNTNSVTDMSFMFYICENLETLDVSGFDTGNVTNMSSMFNYCKSLESLDVSGFDTGNVTDMSDMFRECQSLEVLDVSGFDTGNVTDMNAMFCGCIALETLDVTGFDTGNVTNMSGMFIACNAFETLDVTGFNTSNVTDMNNMFAYCNNLKTLDISNFDTSNVTNMYFLFCGDTNLTTIYVGEGWTTENVTESYLMFNECTSLVGGMGTTYDANHIDAEYAHIDGGTENPGYFTAAMTSITLAEMLENGTDGEKYIISDDLAVVEIANNANYAFLTDGNNNWIKVEFNEDNEVAFYNDYIKGGTLKGVLSGSDLNPVLTVIGLPEEGENIVNFEIANITLDEPLELKVNQVVNVTGFWNAAEEALRAYSEYPQGQSLSLNTSWASPTNTLENGKRYRVRCAINIKEAWRTTAGAHIKDYEYDFQNYQAYALVMPDTPTDINDVPIDYTKRGRYNILGQPVDKDYKGLVIEKGKKVLVK